MLKFGGSSCLIGDPERRRALKDRAPGQRVGGPGWTGGEPQAPRGKTTGKSRHVAAFSGGHAKSTLAECFVLAIWQVVETITTPARIVCTRFEQDDQT